MPKIRVPLENTIETRDPSLLKDSLIENGFIDKGVNGTSYVTKRPGLDLKITGTGIGRGAFYYNGNIYTWEDTLKGIYHPKLAENNTVMGLMVGGELNQVVYSSSPTKYVVRTLPNSPAFSSGAIPIGYALGQWWVSHSNGADLLSSTDGVSWSTIATSGLTDSTKLETISYLGTRLISTYYYSSTHARSAYSDDNGVTWDKSFGTYYMPSRAFLISNGTIVTNGTAHTSDGISWTPTGYTDIMQGFYDSVRGHFVFLTLSGDVIVLDNFMDYVTGYPYTGSIYATFGTIPRVIANLNGNYYMIGGFNRVAKSTDGGENWSFLDTNLFIGDTIIGYNSRLLSWNGFLVYYSIDTYGNDRYKQSTSTDGINWYTTNFNYLGLGVPTPNVTPI